MKYDFDILHDRKNTASVKWDRAVEMAGDGDVLALSVADMEFQSPPEVIEALVKRAASGIYGYSWITESYFQAYVQWMENRYGWSVDEDMMTPVNGVVQTLNISVLAFTQPGDRIIVQAPVYPPFYSEIKNKGRELVVNNLINDSGYYRMDFDMLESQLKNNVKMMILCSPHNPVGRLWQDWELKQLVGLLAKYNVMLISDEIHADIVYGSGKHICTASLSGEVKDNSVTCVSPTKTFNIPGVGLSSAIIPNREKMKSFVAMESKMSRGPHDVFSPIAAETALTKGGPWLEQLLVYLEDNSVFMEGFMADNMKNVVYIRPEATYLGWLDFRKTGIPPENLHEYIARRAGVVLNDGRTFGPGGEGFLRINFACPRSMLEEALERIKKSLD